MEENLLSWDITRYTCVFSMAPFLKYGPRNLLPYRARAACVRWASVWFSASTLPGMRSSMACRTWDSACGTAPSSITNPSKGLSWPSRQSITLVIVGPIGLYGDGWSRPIAFTVSSVL